MSRCVPVASVRLIDPFGMDPLGMLKARDASVFRACQVVRLVIYIEAEDEDHIEPHLVFQMYCEYGERSKSAGHSSAFGDA